jgi:hypothetical protein
MFDVSSTAQRGLASTKVVQAPRTTVDAQSVIDYELSKRATTPAPFAPTSCSFGACGTTCLDQGAFCCGPGELS